MDLDFQRPPAGVAPRVPNWPIVVVMWLAIIVFIILFYPVNTPTSLPVAIWFWALFLFAVLSTVALALPRLRAARYAGWPGLLWRGPTDPREDWSDEIRLADREEIRARRDFRRGAISRSNYERIIARRQFVHGELTKAQYHKRLGEIAIEEERGAEMSNPEGARPLHG
jgi:hypothetical protein